MALYVEAGFNVADVGSYTLDVIETGGNTFTVTISSGTFFLSTTAASATGDHSSLVTGYVSFLSALQTALNAGTDGGTGYTVSLSASTGLVTIARSSAAGVTAVSLTPTSLSAYNMTGQTGVMSGSLTHVMTVAPYYRITGAVGFWSGYSEREDGDGAAYDVVSHSARPHGIARSVVPVLLDMTAACEPIAVVYRNRAAAALPWTWEHLFRHARNTLPLSIDDGTYVHYTRLTARGAAFVPKQRATDYVGHFDIPLRMRLLARRAS